MKIPPILISTKMLAQQCAIVRRMLDKKGKLTEDEISNVDGMLFALDVLVDELLAHGGVMVKRGDD